MPALPLERIVILHMCRSPNLFLIYTTSQNLLQEYDERSRTKVISQLYIHTCLSYNQDTKMLGSIVAMAMLELSRFWVCKKRKDRFAYRSGCISLDRNRCTVVQVVDEIFWSLCMGRSEVF